MFSCSSSVRSYPVQSGLSSVCCAMTIVCLVCVSAVRVAVFMRLLVLRGFSWVIPIFSCAVCLFVLNGWFIVRLVLILSPWLVCSLLRNTGLLVVVSSRHSLLMHVAVRCVPSLPVHGPQSVGQLHVFSGGSHWLLPHSFGLGMYAHVPVLQMPVKCGFAQSVFVVHSLGVQLVNIRSRTVKSSVKSVVFVNVFGFIGL